MDDIDAQYERLEEAEMTTGRLRGILTEYRRTDETILDVLYIGLRNTERCLKKVRECKQSFVTDRLTEIYEAELEYMRKLIATLEERRIR